MRPTSLTRCPEVTGDLATCYVGCQRQSPKFDKAWELLFELTEKPLDPDKPLFEKLVNLLALHPVAQ